MKDERRKAEQPEVLVGIDVGSTTTKRLWLCRQAIVIIKSYFLIGRDDHGSVKECT